ncbi:putative TIR domain, AAA+ ATPase domain, P-loop containing nucleoside triphosphate hydrolase [Helianthus annuus]|nr:putative TIR domain, AAA+ ATPase domain, P-loop containing nucleoside triphosphate hydrolase [Helianthus annuus]
MASISSSSSRPNNTPVFTYDVFLSFRGEDTRHTFTDHLYEALLGAGVRTFRDNDAIDRGQELKPEIETAIINSRASIVVLSENYANSRWCLDELCLILEQRRELNHFVIPVFYHVDPSDVRNQRESFAIQRSRCFSSCLACSCVNTKQGSKWTEDNVRRWKAALTEFANLTGMVLSGSRSETNFIAEVVETTKRKLDLKQLSIPAHLVGMEARVEVINSWLYNDQHSVIAICGMGGSGKTTLAQHIYNLNKQDFKSSSFIEVNGKQPYGLLGLQNQLLKDVLGGKGVSVSSVFEGTSKIEVVLQTKRVLIVLDDIDQHEQLSALLGTKAIPTQSKIIITTRFLGIHAWFGSISRSCLVHKLNLLNDHESLELLSSHAFGSKIPIEGFKELAVQLAKYCGGNPLALKVLGSSLYVSDNEPWMRNNMREVWESRLNSLNSLKGDLDCNIQSVLQKSFDSLPLRSHKELFLHIACIFVGEYLDVVKFILEDELNAKSGILTLVNRCLLTISHDRLTMHQLLQEMGRKVVCDESKDPAKRSRVWRDVESYHVLRKGIGSNTIEGLSLDMRKVEQGMRSETSTLDTSSLAKMDKLKLLHLRYVELTGSYENFPELIWLCWHRCRLKTLPSALSMSTLVVIVMSDGHLEKFEVPMVLNSLKYLSFKGCDKLVRICNLYRLPKLDTLILWNCSSLTHLCKSVGDLEKLSWLDMGGCTKMWKYVNQQETMMLSLPQSNILLDFTNCDLDNDDFCVTFHARSLFDLCLAANPFEYLPSNIDLKMLRKLNLYCCTNLKSLPCIPSTLVDLNIDWCTSLQRVTFESGHFGLQEFAYECCFKLSEIQGLFKLVPIAKINEEDLGHMQWIKAYEDHKVDLVGDDITKGRIWHTQMLYEYGIMSTFLQGINDQILTTYEYTSSSSSLSFRVPCHHEKNRIQGLNLSCLYRSSGSKDKGMWILFAKISNRSKDLTWIYNPVVYCKPKIDEDAAWVSYWPLGNILDSRDEVDVDIYVEEGTMIVSGCGASLVYMDGEADEEAKCQNDSMKDKEVIGGDLSEFMVTSGGYYLCRRDFFGPKTFYWLEWMFGDDVHYKDSQGWRKTYQSMRSKVQREHVISFRKTIELGVGFNSESDIDKIEKAVYSLVGIESVSSHKEMGKLIVNGFVDPVEVATCVREFDNMVEILSVKLVLDKIE